MRRQKMKKNETLKVMAVINATYPTQFLKLDEDVIKTMVNIWQEMFCNDSYENVILAVKNYIAVDLKGFIPTIGMIKEAIRKIQYPDDLTEQEAINLIMKSLEDAYYNGKKAFNSLPDILKAVVGSPSQLSQWSLMEIDTVQSVIASNIARSYRVLLERQQEQQKTGRYIDLQVAPPEEIKQLDSDKAHAREYKPREPATQEEAMEFIRQARENIGKINGK
jgi:hypothetical protein